MTEPEIVPVLPNNNWTPEKQRKLLDWQQQSRIHSVGHARAEELYTNKKNRILIPSVIIGAIAALFDGISLVWTDIHKPFIVVALLLTAIVTVLNGILQITKPETRASDHADMSKGYNRVILEIDNALAKEPCERMNGSQFLSKIMTELTALKAGGVKIPTSVWKEIKRGFLKGELEFQKVADDPNVPFLTKATIHRKTTKPRLQDQPKPLVGEPTGVDLVSTPTTSPTEPTAATASTALTTPTTTTDTVTNTSIVDIDENTTGTGSLPRFELIIDNDPVSQKIQERLFEFQMNRFG